MPRPISIVNFERCYLAAWLIGIVNLALTWNARMEVAAISSGGQINPAMVGTMALVGVVVGSAISLTLWWFAARCASAVAKWIVVVFYGFGLLGLIGSFARGTLLPGAGAALEIAGLVLQTIAIVLLFRPDATAWFAARGRVPTP